jgi:hypothetical protein
VIKTSEEARPESPVLDADPTLRTPIPERLAPSPTSPAFNWGVRVVTVPNVDNDVGATCAGEVGVCAYPEWRRIRNNGDIGAFDMCSEDVRAWVRSLEGKCAGVL